MRRSNIFRSDQSRLKAVTQSLKLFSDGFESSRKLAWDVFEEHHGSLHVVKDPPNIWPQGAMVVFPEAEAGKGVRLTWRAGNDEIHAVTPRFCLEEGDVRKKRSRIQASFFHRLYQSADGECFDFNVTLRDSIAKRQFDAEIEPSDSREQGEDANFRLLGSIHIIPQPYAWPSALSLMGYRRSPL